MWRAVQLASQRTGPSSGQEGSLLLTLPLADTTARPTPPVPLPGALPWAREAGSPAPSGRSIYSLRSQRDLLSPPGPDQGQGPASVSGHSVEDTSTSRSRAHGLSACPRDGVLWITPRRVLRACSWLGRGWPGLTFQPFQLEGLSSAVGLQPQHVISPQRAAPRIPPPPNHREALLASLTPWNGFFL